MTTSKDGREPSDDPTPVPGDIGVQNQAGRLTSALERARARQTELREQGLLERLDPIERAKRRPESLRLAINAKCFDCQGRNDDPGVIERIRTCLSPGCPLYPVRPYKDSPEEEAERLKALRERRAHMLAEFAVRDGRKR